MNEGLVQTPRASHAAAVGASTSGKIPKLDFLRAVSAAIVILYHSGNTIVPAGYGVLTFFVISGFLITWLLLQENEKSGTVSLKGFYMRRSLRIFPAFYVYWIIAIALLAFHARIPWAQAIASFFYVCNYYQGLHGYPSTPFSHTWSLGVEEQFYLLWPWVFYYFRNRLGTLAQGLCIAIPVLWLYRSLLHFHGVDEAYIYTSFETRVDAILCGCLLAILLFTGVARTALATIRRGRYLPITLLLLTASVVANNHHGIGYRNVIGFSIDPILIAVLIAQLIVFRHADWMDATPISYLGRISYSTYLYQQLVIPFVVRMFPKISGAPFMALTLAITWIVAAISFECVEKPFLKLKDRFRFHKPRAA
jgi:peptidoglycan/LPS O-acetylase OafA/YrhL